MDDALRVGVPDGLGEGVHDGVNRDGFAVLQHPFERPALDEFHREERPAVGEDADLVYGRDSGVLEPARDLRLFDEPGRGRGVRRVLFVKDFDGDVPVHRPVGRAEDDAHPAPAQFAREFVTRRHDGRRRRRGAEHGARVLGDRLFDFVRERVEVIHGAALSVTP